MKTVDFDKGPKSILVSECRWSFLVAPTLCETPSRYTHISVEERILFNELLVKSPDDSRSRSRRTVSLTPAEGRKKERKKIESTGVCSAWYYEFLHGDSLGRALKSGLLDLAQVKNSRRTRFDSPDFHSPDPYCPPTFRTFRLRVSWRKKRKRQTALRDSSHSLLSTDSLTNRTGIVVSRWYLLRRVETRSSSLRIRCIPLVRSRVSLATLRLLGVLHFASSK